MKLTLRLIGNLRKVLEGEAIPYSSLPKPFADSLVREGLMNVEYHGSRRCLRTPDAEALAGTLPQYNEALCDLEAAELMLSGNNSRAAQASLSGNSKIRSERSCPGFLVNTYARMECLLNGKAFTIDPAEGSAVYVADWKTFIPPANALIVGVENMENFLKIRNQMHVFQSCLNKKETQVLFAARYAFSSDLMNWLARIPNRYVHFGDFDLAGIAIFLNQFKPYVGERGSFLIPSDIESRLERGSSLRYDEQYRKYLNLTDSDPAVNQLISLIHRYRKTYDQEGYILNKT